MLGLGQRSEGLDRLDVVALHGDVQRSDVVVQRDLWNERGGERARWGLRDDRGVIGSWRSRFRHWPS